MEVYKNLTGNLRNTITTQVPKTIIEDFTMQELPGTRGIIESQKQKDSIDAMPEGRALL